VLRHGTSQAAQEAVWACTPLPHPTYLRARYTQLLMPCRGTSSCPFCRADSHPAACCARSMLNRPAPSRIERGSVGHLEAKRFCSHCTHTRRAPLCVKKSTPVSSRKAPLDIVRGTYEDQFGISRGRREWCGGVSPPHKAQALSVQCLA